MHTRSDWCYHRGVSSFEFVCVRGVRREVQIIILMCVHRTKKRWRKLWVRVYNNERDEYIYYYDLRVKFFQFGVRVWYLIIIAIAGVNLQETRVRFPVTSGQNKMLLYTAAVPFNYLLLSVWEYFRLFFFTAAALVRNVQRKRLADILTVFISAHFSVVCCFRC